MYFAHAEIAGPTYNGVLRGRVMRLVRIDGPARTAWVYDPASDTWDEDPGYYELWERTDELDDQSIDEDEVEAVKADLRLR